MIGLATDSWDTLPWSYGCVLCSYTHSVEFTSLWKVGVHLSETNILTLLLFMCVSS